MPIISGPITALAGDSTARVYVAATEVHPHEGGVMTDEPCRVSITNGVLSFEAPEGVGVLTIKTAGGVEKTLPILVKEGYTLADALLAGDVEALPASKIDELAERLAGMAAGNPADLTGKLEETGDGELTVGGAYEKLTIGAEWGAAALPAETYLNKWPYVTLATEFEYMHDMLNRLQSGSDVLLLPPVVDSALREAITYRGYDPATVEEIPFEFESQLSASMGYLFSGMTALKTVPEFSHGACRNFEGMFGDCTSLETIGDIYINQDLGQIMMDFMFANCASLQDGQVRIIVDPDKPMNFTTDFMIGGSGLTRKPFFTRTGEPIDVP